MVIALIPGVRGRDLQTCLGMITSIWVSTKKPRLATTAVPVDHTVALRIIQMKPEREGSRQMWMSDNDSTAWVVLPHAIVAVLDLESSEQSLEKTFVKISQESLDLLERIKGIQEWWPRFEDHASGGKKSHHPVLFVHRQGRKRKAEGEDASAKASANKWVRRAARSKKKPEEIPEETKNFKRSQRGDALIRQMMEKVKGMDCKVWDSNPVFSRDDDLCRLKDSEKSKGIPWARFLEKAPTFFKAELLDFFWM